MTCAVCLLNMTQFMEAFCWEATLLQFVIRLLFSCSVSNKMGDKTKSYVFIIGQHGNVSCQG